MVIGFGIVELNSEAKNFIAFQLIAFLLKKDFFYDFRHFWSRNFYYFQSLIDSHKRTSNDVFRTTISLIWKLIKWKIYFFGKTEPFSPDIFLEIGPGRTLLIKKRLFFHEFISPISILSEISRAQSSIWTAAAPAYLAYRNTTYCKIEQSREFCSIFIFHL